MNIAIFTDTFLPKIDGIAVSVDHFCRILAKKGHNFTICCPKYNEGEDPDYGPAIQIYRFKNTSLPSYPDVKVVLPSQKKIFKSVRDFKADIIHIQTPGLLGQYGVVASRMFGVPIVGTYHTLVSEQEAYLSLYRLLRVEKLLDLFLGNKSIKKRLQKLERVEEFATKNLKKALIWKLSNKIYEACQTIITPTEMIKKELVEHGVKKPISVISNGMDFSLFRNGQIKEVPQQRPPKLIHVGRISFEKNVEVVLRAFALLQKRFQGITLDVYGDGPALASMKIEARNLTDITFHGFVSRDQLPNIYPNYDVFLTASTMETQGLVVLEAMASGLPCVGVNSFALPELIQDNRNGFVVPPGNHQLMADRTEALLKDSNMFRSFSEQSLEIAKGHNIIECADRLEELYQSVIRDYRKSAPKPVDWSDFDEPLDEEIVVYDN
ncbi:MAG: glycosyltransferase [Leptonema sp. (in: Bacteria)]|nr:glycosyltransferase [Leptonema sp. (in: bacteria)]